MARSLLLLVTLASSMPIVSAFFATSSSTPKAASAMPKKDVVVAAATALPSPEESAKALTDYMAKAHEEKLRAVTEVQNKYNLEIQQLQDKLKALEETKNEANNAVVVSGNSAFPPATNKDLTNKVAAYQAFVSSYVVNAQLEKSKAVQTAEANMKAKYEALLAAAKENQ